MYIKWIERHAYHGSGGFGFGGMYHPLMIYAVNYHFVVNALEHYGFNDSGELSLVRRNYFNVLRSDNDVYTLIGGKSLIDAFKAVSCKFRNAVLRHNAADDIAFADKISYESVYRFVVYIRWSAYLLDIAVVHNNDAVAHGKSFLLIVSNVDES